MATDTSKAEDRVKRRYPQRTKWILVLIAVPLAAALVGWALWAGTRQARVGISAEVHGFQVVNADRIDVMVDVHRPDPSKAGTCLVQAKAASGQVVGEANLAVPAGESKQTRVGATIRTVGEATTATVSACRLV